MDRTKEEDMKERRHGGINVGGNEELEKSRNGAGTFKLATSGVRNLQLFYLSPVALCGFDKKITRI